jgi:hypothetical protein
MRYGSLFLKMHYFSSMKKQILPTLIIGIVLFMWQFISWAAGNFHGSAQRYTPHQDTIMATLNQLALEDGRYMLPSVSPEVPSEQAQQQWESFMGKPWAFITYHNAHEMSMGMSMLRGFLADLVGAWILFSMLSAMGPLTLGRSVFMSLGFGMFSFIYITYTNHIWYPTFDLMASFLDAIVPFSMIGILNARFWNKAS